jgi:hypothetical protein
MEPILITDDDRACRDTLQRALELAGYSSVDEALSAIGEKPVRFVRIGRTRHSSGD